MIIFALQVITRQRATLHKDRSTFSNTLCFRSVFENTLTKHKKPICVLKNGIIMKNKVTYFPLGQYNIDKT